MVEEAYSLLLQEAYAPENFELYVDICAKKIADYLTQNIEHASTTPVFATGLTPQKADNLFKDWLVQSNSLSDTEQFASFIDLVLQHSMHLHHPHYLGHQVAPTLPIAAVIDMLAALLNNSSVVFEMGPMEAVLEKHMIERFAAHIGWNDVKGDQQPGGFFTSGGSLGNLSSLLAARNKLMQETNAQSMEKMGVIVSEESHYSIIRSLRILGVSDAYIFKVPSAELSMDSLQDSLYMARKKGIHIFATVISACSTATGTFDDIEEVAKFCQRENIWLHVDAAHGGAALLSKRLRPLLKGIEHADSIIVDAHKMMLMPALLTAVIFRNCKDPQRSCPENAHFLFDDAMENDWYTLGRQTLECTKKMMVLKLFIAMRLYGESFFADYVERCYDLTQYFYELLQRSEHLTPLKRPDFNIICFKVKHANTAFQLKVRDALLQQGEFYIVSAQVAGETYLRCTIINPHTTEDVLHTLIRRIEHLADNFRDGSITSTVPGVLCGT